MRVENGFTGALDNLHPNALDNALDNLHPNVASKKNGDQGSWMFVNDPEDFTAYVFISKPRQQLQF